MQLLIVGFLCTGFAFLSLDAASRQTVLVVSRADAKRGRGVGVTSIFARGYTATRGEIRTRYLAYSMHSVGKFISLLVFSAGR